MSIASAAGWCCQPTSCRGTASTGVGAQHVGCAEGCAGALGTRARRCFGTARLSATSREPHRAAGALTWRPPSAEWRTACDCASRSRLGCSTRSRPSARARRPCRATRAATRSVLTCTARPASAAPARCVPSTAGHHARQSAGRRSAYNAWAALASGHHLRPRRPHRATAPRPRSSCG